MPLSPPISNDLQGRLCDRLVGLRFYIRDNSARCLDIPAQTNGIANEVVNRLFGSHSQ